MHKNTSMFRVLLYSYCEVYVSDKLICQIPFCVRSYLSMLSLSNHDNNYFLAFLYVILIIISDLIIYLIIRGTSLNFWKDKH